MVKYLATSQEMRCVLIPRPALHNPRTRVSTLQATTDRRQNSTVSCYPHIITLKTVLDSFCEFTVVRYAMLSVSDVTFSDHVFICLHATCLMMGWRSHGWSICLPWVTALYHFRVLVFRQIAAEYCPSGNCCIYTLALCTTRIGQ
jgi:hypothetical protein